MGVDWSERFLDPCPVTVCLPRDCWRTRRRNRERSEKTRWNGSQNRRGKIEERPIRERDLLRFNYRNVCEARYSHPLSLELGKSDSLLYQRCLLLPAPPCPYPYLLFHPCIFLPHRSISLTPSISLTSQA
ncbi:hypothetical protein KQX54_011907 [Cotesia glomerata]|uniref:Uncharacterized protein n=1 Tax=Cotesia glomerata TaxID=32391 RepID=A0AAV7J8N6_COTGL|nr:hypothetical protein KQX54_011907 [Cotesia glomerata]